MPLSHDSNNSLHYQKMRIIRRARRSETKKRLFLRICNYFSQILLKKLQVCRTFRIFASDWGEIRSIDALACNSHLPKTPEKLLME
jgi:hypothetical protein